MQEMPKRGLTPDGVSYTLLMMAHEKGGRWEDAVEVYAACKRAGQPRNSFTYRALISALTSGRQLDKAFQVTLRPHRSMCRATMPAACRARYGLRQPISPSMSSFVDYMITCAAHLPRVCGSKTPHALRPMPPAIAM